MAISAKSFEATGLSDYGVIIKILNQKNSFLGERSQLEVEKFTINIEIIPEGACKADGTLYYTSNKRN